MILQQDRPTGVGQKYLGLDAAGVVASGDSGLDPRVLSGLALLRSFLGSAVGRVQAEV